MAFYTKKPVMIEAIQFLGVDSKKIPLFSEYPSWLEQAMNKKIIYLKTSKALLVKTMEGNMVVSKDDYIIKDISDELYSCHPIVFNKTYAQSAL